MGETADRHGKADHNTKPLKAEKEGGEMQRETEGPGKEEAVGGVQAAEDKIMTLVQAAEYLETSYSTVYRLVTDGELRAFRLRNSWRTSTSACREFVNKRFEEQSVICRSGETK